MSRLRLATIRFLFWSLAIQVLVITIGGNILPDLFAAFDATTLIALMLVSEGLIAGGAAAAFWMPRSWQALNALLPCAIYLASVQVGPAWLYFVALLLLLIFFGPTLFNRVPYYPTAKAGYEAIDALVAKQQPTHFIDLGCGFGGMLFYLAPRYPHINFIGVESAIVPFYITRLLAALRRSPTPQIIWGNIWKLDLADYAMVYTFLSPAPMEELWEKVKNEMRPGSVFITNSFPVPVEADETIQISFGAREQRLFVHRL